MPNHKPSNRCLRVAELIQRELATILREEVHESRWGLITISHVKMAPDLKLAKIYLTIYGAEIDEKDVLQEINKHQKHLRSILAKNIVMRYVPELKFYRDEIQIKAQRIYELLNKN